MILQVEGARAARCGTIARLGIHVEGPVVGDQLYWEAAHLRGQAALLLLLLHILSSIATRGGRRGLAV